MYKRQGDAYDDAGDGYVYGFWGQRRKRRLKEDVGHLLDVPVPRLRGGRNVLPAGVVLLHLRG